MFCSGETKRRNTWNKVAISRRRRSSERGGGVRIRSGEWICRGAAVEAWAALWIHFSSLPLHMNDIETMQQASPITTTTATMRVQCII